MEKRSDYGKLTVRKNIKTAGLAAAACVFLSLGSISSMAEEAVIIPVYEDSGESEDDIYVEIIDEERAFSGKSGADEADDTEAAGASAALLREQPAAKPIGQQVADYAVNFVGNPYRYGGTSLTNGADCSGFVLGVYRNFGVSLPHSSSGLARTGTDVGNNLANAVPGDIICYSGHVGIYIGNGKIVHASTERSGIKISNASYKPIKTIRRVI